MIQSATASEKGSTRCAVYVRKSHEEGLDQPYNSLHAQQEACLAYIKSQGWQPLPADYADGGYTGANLDRPAMQRLIDDIKTGKVDCVVVHRVDRLSRSLMDFARMMELFERHGVSFCSVTQQFNTTTSIGRLTLNVLLSFAQFERELCGERIRDKIASAKKKGKYVGGRPLLGYDVDREKMRLVVNEAEAKLVRHIFKRFCRLGSCMLVARELNEQGHRMKTWVTKKGKPMGGGMWKKTDVHHLLTNRRYLGEVMYKGESYPGEHDAIVDRKAWDRVQRILSENRAVRANQTRSKTSAVLKGLIRCERCHGAR
jgi:site-specific DNA recombinase